MDYKEVLTQDVMQEAVKATPPVSVGALSLAGLPLSDWVLVLTVLYIVLQLFFLLRDKWWRDRDPKG